MVEVTSQKERLVHFPKELVVKGAIEARGHPIFISPRGMCCGQRQGRPIAITGKTMFG
jgi:hypothetical protein